MTENDEMIQALRSALEAAPDNTPLRKHLAGLLLADGRFAEAEKEYRQVLAASPRDLPVKLALAEAFYGQEKWMVATVVLEELLREPSPPPRAYLLAARAFSRAGQLPEAQQAYRDALRRDPSLADPALAAELHVEPPAAPPAAPPERVPVLAQEGAESAPPELERSGVAFKDVGGMDALKEEIRVKIIHPLNHPEIYKAYGKTIGGGILMYGPPGCGKTHLARATAGEVNAYFLPVGIHDVLNMWLGQSEQNLHQLFELARRTRPCVLFIDEVDALGARRSDMRQSAGRQVINQLLSELDGITTSNEGVLVLSATNAPWHMDEALRRPGRFDRVIFVPPPDEPARVAILEIMLRDKPAGSINYGQIARRTEHFSGADLKAVVDLAIEAKLAEAIKRGVPQPLETRDLLDAAKKLKPSTRDWFANARNYALYSNQSGLYDDVLAYIEKSGDGGLLSKVAFWRD